MASMPIAMPGTATLGTDMSRVFLDVASGNAIGSVSADRKTVSVFHYNGSNKLDYIDQYAQAIALASMPIAMPGTATLGTDMSRVFLDVASGNAIGSVSADRKTVSVFHYNGSNKLDYIDQYAQAIALASMPTAMPGTA